MNSANKSVIITSINYPTKAVRRIATNCREWKLIVIGDKKTPSDWVCEEVEFLSVDNQLKLHSKFAKACKFNHYVRKNIGYIKAIQDGAEIIAETDDDNIPYDNFLTPISKFVEGKVVTSKGWNNVYKYFVEDKVKIWPRGFPLENVNESFADTIEVNTIKKLDCPIQQYLADGDPDVDAVYRLTTEGEIKFKSNTVIMSNGCFCPFNSQNTIWWPEAYPLLYLPSFVTFRMTDIWRSFIAQVCIYALGKNIAFREPTVFQERNQHCLISDFKDEIPGYLNNKKIIDLLRSLNLSQNFE